MNFFRRESEDNRNGGPKVAAVEALVDMLVREGVEVIFGVPGGPVMPLFDALADHPTIVVVLTKHEESAAYAAYAYARVTGKLGVCVATLGPGATNLLAGIPIAYMTSTPVLAITGQVQTTAFGHGAHQETTGWMRAPDQNAMFAPTVKHSALCDQPDRFVDYVRHSLRIAQSGRPGPVHLSIPANLLHQEIAYTPLEPGQYRVLAAQVCDEAALAAIAERIAQAHYPLLLAGERVTLPDATAELQALSEACGIPVMADMACKGAVDEASPQFLGIMGVMGHKAGERYLKEHADLVISVGQTFNEISTLSWDPAIGANGQLIQLDSDPEELGKVYPMLLGSAGHLPTMLRRLRELITARAVAPATNGAGGRERVVAELRRKHPLFEDGEMRSEKTPLAPARVVAELRKALPRDAVVLADSSKWVRWLGRYFEAGRGTFVGAHDYEPMGWAVAGVIGARYGVPQDRPVVCVSGDGAFMMSAMELATAANHNLNVIWLVMNDERLGIIHDLQVTLYGGRISATTYRNPDFVQFAAAFGIRGYLIEKPGQLAEGLAAAVKAGGPALFDVRFDREAVAPVRPRSLLITKNMGLPNPKPGPEVTRAMIQILKDR